MRSATRVRWARRLAAVAPGKAARPARMEGGCFCWSDARLPWLVLDDDLPPLPRDHGG